MTKPEVDCGFFVITPPNDTRVREFWESQRIAAAKIRDEYDTAQEAIFRHQIKESVKESVKESLEPEGDSSFFLRDILSRTTSGEVH